MVKKYKCTFQALSGFTCEDAYVNPNTRHMGGIYDTLEDCQNVCDGYNDSVDYCTTNFNNLCKGKGYQSCIKCVQDNEKTLFARGSCTGGLYASMCALPKNKQICGEKFNVRDCPAERPKMNPYHIFEWEDPETLTKADFQQYCCTKELSPQQGPYYEDYTKCIDVLEANCDGARRASLGNCFVCGNTHMVGKMEDCPGSLLDKFCVKKDGEELCGKDKRECPNGTYKSDLDYYHPTKDNWEDRCCKRPMVKVSNSNAVLCNISKNGGKLSGPSECASKDETKGKPGDDDTCDEWYYWDKFAKPPPDSLIYGNWVGCQKNTSLLTFDDCKAGDPNKPNYCSVYKCPTTAQFNNMKTPDGKHYCKNLDNTNDCVQCIENQSGLLWRSDNKFSYKEPGCKDVRVALCSKV
jgi:hypothetical protein